MGTEATVRRPDPIAVNESTDRVSKRTSFLRWCVCLAVLALAAAFAVPAGAALVFGIVLGVFGANPAPKKLKAIQTKLLGSAVALMGAGLDFHSVVKVGTQGVLLTAALLFAVFLVGWAAAKALRLDRDESILVTAGTAICGASAIAALTAALKPKETATAYALTVVFVLNAVALVLLPPLGQALGMTDQQFGWWAALAIHDTSSVVGATMAFGGAALALGTTVKLSRALWIVPMTAWLSTRRHSGGPVKWSVPWFLPAFLVLSAAVTAFAFLEPARVPAVWMAKRGFVVGLFLVGLSLDRESVRRFPWRLALFGVVLWLWSLVASLGPAWILGAR